MENESDDTLRTLCEGILGVEPIGGEGCDGPVKELEAELVKHYPGNIDGTGDEFLSLAVGKRVT